ncbi:serine protease [Caballeronia sp. Lep1P3]|uniref:S1 family peptidase n=1 Tax=Caballeronia sp. Lep1P3 TaxID=2878150 RepID=UPI001FD1103C|nr:serine protease [Caballeronia sp. Lep1P3]
MLRTDALAASRERIDVSRVGSSVEESAPLAQRPGLRRSGTAFFVARDGDLLTTAHTLRGCKRIEVWPDDDSRLVASLVSVDTALDVAVLATHRSVSRIAVARAGPAGARVAAWTIAFGLTPSTPLLPVFTRGSVDGTVDIDARRLLAIHARLYEGNSGGPVIDDQGFLLGMIVGRYQARPDMAVAVRASDLAGFLRTRAGAERDEPKRSSPDPQRTLRAISALVQCVQ